MKQFTLLLSLFIFTSSFAGRKPDVDLQYIKMMNDLVRIKVPASFKAMTATKHKKYYPKEALPKLVYADTTEQIRISFDAEPLSAHDSSIVIVHKGISIGIDKFHPKSKKKDEGIEKIHGRKVGYIEYINKKPEKYYEFVFYTIWKGQVLSCVFRHPKKKHRHWKPIARQMMQSLVIQTGKK